MKHRFSPLFSIVISLITLLTTGFVTANTVKQVITVEKKVAVIFMKVSPDCSSEAACEPGFPAGLRANIHEPRYSAGTYGALISQTMTPFITQATYNHTHMTFTAIVNPNSSNGWFDAPHALERYNDPANNPDPEYIFDDALALAFSVVGDDIATYDSLLVVHNFQSQFGVTYGCGYTPPGGYVTCPMNVPTSLGYVNKLLNLVHIGEHENLDRMMAVLGHELGHVHNLFHVRMGPYDIVGDSPVLVHYGGWSKSRAGWVPEMTDLVGNDAEITVALDPLEYPGHNVLRIPYLNYGNNFAGFIVECRAKIGFDTKIPEEGVIVTYADTNYVEGQQGHLEGRQAVIQFPENDGDYNDAALQPGESYVNTDLNLTITYLNKDSSNRCVVKAIRGQAIGPDPMITPYSESDSGLGYIQYSSRDIWIDSQANGWDVYPPGYGLTQEGGEWHPTGYGDPFWVNHENRIKYMIRNTGYSDAFNVLVDIYVTQPIVVYDECDDESYLNNASLIDTQQINLLEKDGFYFGEVPWTPTSHAAAQVKVVIRDYMGEVTHANNAASETYASQNIIAETFGELHATEVLGAFSHANKISLKSSLKCFRPFDYSFTRKVISAIDRKYWVINEGINFNALAPGEEQVVPFSGTPPKDALPGECEEVLMELRVKRDDFYVPVDGFTFKSCVVAPSTLTCSAPQQPVELGRYASTAVNLSPAKGGETIAIDYISPTGKHQIINRNVMSNGAYTNRFKPDVPGKWQMLAYWQGSDSTAPAESGICTFEVFSNAPGFTLTADSNCRSGPGTDYEVLTSARTSTVMPIDARSEDGQWLYGMLNRQLCWIYSGLGIYNGNLFDLPVREPKPTEVPIVPVLRPTVIFRLPAPLLDVCRTYTTQAICLRHKDTCKWVIQPTGVGVCVKK